MGKTIRVKRDPRGGMMIDERATKRAKREARKRRDVRRGDSTNYAALMQAAPRKGKRTHKMAAIQTNGWQDSPYLNFRESFVMNDTRWSK